MALTTLEEADSAHHIRPSKTSAKILSSSQLYNFTEITRTTQRLGAVYKPISSENEWTHAHVVHPLNNRGRNTNLSLLQNIYADGKTAMANDDESGVADIRQRQTNQLTIRYGG